MVLDKLKFWKKDDEFSHLSSDLGGLSDDPMARQSEPLAQNPDPLANPTPGMNTDPMQTSFGDMDQGSSFSPTPGVSQYREPSTSTSPMAQHSVPESYEDYPQGRDRDMELVLAKLDSIKSELDSLHQRVRKIERTGERKRSAW